MKQITINYLDGATEYLESPIISVHTCPTTTNFVLKDENENKLREVRVYNDKIKNYEITMVEPLDQSYRQELERMMMQKL